MERGKRRELPSFHVPSQGPQRLISAPGSTCLISLFPGLARFITHFDFTTTNQASVEDGGGSQCLGMHFGFVALLKAVISPFGYVLKFYLF